MKQQITLNVTPRAQTGRSASRRLRKTNQVPAILYGKHTAPESLAIDGGTHFLSDLEAGANFGSGFRDANLWLAQLTNNVLPANSIFCGNCWMGSVQTRVGVDGLAT